MDSLKVAFYKQFKVTIWMDSEFILMVPSQDSLKGLKIEIKQIKLLHMITH